MPFDCSATRPSNRFTEPTKSATKPVGRCFVDFTRRTGLNDLAAIHHADAGRQRHRLFLIVRHDDERYAALRPESASARTASVRATVCRARRAARPTAARGGASPTLAPVQHVGAGRPTADPGRRLIRLSISTSFSAPTTRSRISAFGSPSCRRPNPTLRSTFMCGNSAYDWNIMFTGRRCGGISVTSSPPMNRLPDVGRSKPASNRSSVVLPLPEPPSSAKHSPSATSSETSSTATTSPKRLLTPSKRTSGSVVSRPLWLASMPGCDYVRSVRIWG